MAVPSPRRQTAEGAPPPRKGAVRLRPPVPLRLRQGLVPDQRPDEDHGDGDQRPTQHDGQEQEEHPGEYEPRAPAVPTRSAGTRTDAAQERPKLGLDVVADGLDRPDDEARRTPGERQNCSLARRTLRPQVDDPRLQIHPVDFLPLGILPNPPRRSTSPSGVVVRVSRPPPAFPIRGGRSTPRQRRGDADGRVNDARGVMTP